MQKRIWSCKTWNCCFTAEGNRYRDVVSCSICVKFFYLILSTENFNIVHSNNEPILKAFSTLRLRKLLYIRNELNYIFNCVRYFKRVYEIVERRVWVARDTKCFIIVINWSRKTSLIARKILLCNFFCD